MVKRAFQTRTNELHLWNNPQSSRQRNSLLFTPAVVTIGQSSQTSDEALAEMHSYLRCSGTVDFLPHQDAKVRPGQKAAEDVANFIMQGTTCQERVVQRGVVEDPQNHPVLCTRSKKNNVQMWMSVANSTFWK